VDDVLVLGRKPNLHQSDYMDVFQSFHGVIGLRREGWQLKVSLEEKLLQIYKNESPEVEKEVRVHSFGLQHPNSTHTAFLEDAAQYRYQLDSGVYKFWHFFNDSMAFDAKLS